MKIILKANVKNVGNKNEIVKVADGFATNSLIPKGLAIAATPSELKKLEIEQANYHEQLKQEAKMWMNVKKEIESKVFVEFGKAKNGVFIGNISRKHVLEILNKNLSIKLSKQQLPNKYDFGMGINSYPIQLYPEISTIAKIEIKEENNE